MNKDTPKFRELLDGHYQWPAEYLFKFIVPSQKIEELKSLFPKVPGETRPSRTGKYITFSMRKTVGSSDEVVEVYQKVKVVEGLISL